MILFPKQKNLEKSEKLFKFAVQVAVNAFLLALNDVTLVASSISV